SGPRSARGSSAVGSGASRPAPRLGPVDDRRPPRAVRRALAAERPRPRAPAGDALAGVEPGLPARRAGAGPPRAGPGGRPLGDLAGAGARPLAGRPRARRHAGLAPPAGGGGG